METEAKSYTKKPKILIIEDDQNSRESWKRVLMENGFEVFEAGDGESGIRLIEQELPDLLLCDILLPQTDGIKVCEKIRESEPISRIPIILTSGVFKDLSFRMNVIKRLADDFIEKPFTEADLLAKINKILFPSQ
jgi:DNA-binding response OmpR family regulator